MFKAWHKPFFVRYSISHRIRSNERTYTQHIHRPAHQGTHFYTFSSLSNVFAGERCQAKEVMRKRNRVNGRETEATNAVIHYVKVLFCTHSRTQSVQEVHITSTHTRTLLTFSTCRCRSAVKDEEKKTMSFRISIRFFKLRQSKINTIKIIFIPHKILSFDCAHFALGAVHQCSSCGCDLVLCWCWCCCTLHYYSRHGLCVYSKRHVVHLGQTIIICTDMVCISETREHFLNWMKWLR